MFNFLDPLPVSSNECFKLDIFKLRGGDIIQFNSLDNLKQKSIKRLLYFFKTFNI